MTSNMATQQPSSASNQSVQVDLLPRPTTMPINFGSQQLPLDGRETSQALVQASAPTSRPNPLIFSNKQPMEMLRSPKDQISKSVFLGLQQPERGSKLHAGIEPFPKLQNQAPVNAGESFPITSNKQKAQMESLQKLQTTSPRTAGSQLSSMVNKHPVQTELPVKVQTGFGSVRSKLRESLTSALATGSKEQNEPKLLEKKSIGDCKEADSIFNEQVGREKDDIVMDDVPFSGHNIMEDELLQGHGLHWASDFDSVNADPMQNSSLKRPKLMDVAENNDTKDTVLKASEKLSVLIEAELFKLFGGVNKKYKEKGRSLLFNLKDPSNPELRERVLSGEVSPERLCSMTAEELASKELSQWRQAKAEEFAQMVVLPDMNIDIRRLVKKTHKGEFQVEFDQDDGAHVEVGLGSDAPSKMLAKSNDVDQSQPRSTDKSDSNGRNVSGSLDHRLPEKTDYIQDIMVEELKDTELLPSVVSLDEFMQALDSEPPFESMEVNSLQENLSSVDRNLERSDSESIHPHDSSGHKVDSTQGTKSHSGRIHTKHAKEISSSNNGQVDYSYQKSDDKLKTDGAYAKYITEIPDSESKCNIIWEGFLQLNVSALSNVVSFFLSGERISMQEWPSLLEVKGRVRLDAFEKFLQELPLSRSRTIMLVEFRWKEGSLESGRAHFSEAVHSYITDERLGFAEPVPGVELYLCPSHPKITGILTSHLSKELLDSISCVLNGLIGIVVWRRPPVAASPRVSSRHRRHGGSKKHSGSKKRQESLKHSSHRIPMPRPDEEDDVPPGFGPRPVAKEDDDLPEFDFSGGRTSHRAGAARASSHALPAPAAAPASASPSDHMRELIQKYGQGGSTVGRELGIPVQPWNDDDDIPEWNPNQNTKKMPQSMPLPPPPLPPPQHHLYQQQQGITTQPFGINQNLMPLQYMQAPPPPPMQPPVGVMQPNNAMRWPGPRGMPDGCLRPHGGGQLSGGRPPGPVVAPRMVQGIGGVRNGLGFWRPDNSSGSRGI